MQLMTPQTCWNNNEIWACSSIFIATGFEPMVRMPYSPNSEKTIRNQPIMVIESGRFCIFLPVLWLGQTSVVIAEHNCAAEAKNSGAVGVRASRRMLHSER